MSDDVVIVQPQKTIVVVQEAVTNVVTTSPGPQGPAGPAGPVGPAGTVFYVHDQSVPSNVWTIDHNLNGNPTAVVMDSAGTMCEGQFAYPSTNRMVISFSSAFGGTAYVI